MRLILLLLLFVPVSIFAQKVDIDQYRQSVADYSYTLKKSALAVDYAAYNLAAKRTGNLPSVTLSGEFTEQFQSVDGQESWSFAMQPQVSQTIYGGGLVRSQVEIAALDVEVAELDAVYDLLEVCYNADYYYYHLWAMRSFRDAVDSYVDIIKSLREVVSLRYDEGYISKGDLLMIETHLSEALYEQIAMGEDYTIALQKFNILRGYAADHQVEQHEVDAQMAKLPARVSLEELLARRPDFLALIAAEQQAECSVALVRAGYNPTLSAGVAGLWRPNSPNINGSTTMDGSLFVKLSATIFHFGERRRAVNAAMATRASSELSTLALIDDIRLEESNMWATIVDTKAQMEAAERALSIGSENLEISTFSYSEGLTTILDVMQSQISWLQLYANSIWSRFNFMVSLSAYRRISADLDCYK